MSRATHDALWKIVTQTFNQNPQGISLNTISNKIPIKAGFTKDNSHLIIVDHIDVLRDAGFLKVVHTATLEGSLISVYHPIWKIPKNITSTEARDLSKQPDWMMWFKYPEGNIA